MTHRNRRPQFWLAGGLMTFAVALMTTVLLIIVL